MKFKHCWIWILILYAGCVLTACSTDDKEIDSINQRINEKDNQTAVDISIGDYVNALVTAKTDEHKFFILQESEKRKLIPVNLLRNPFGDEKKEVRAVAKYAEATINQLAGSSLAYPVGYIPVQVAAIDSILTKQAVISLGDELNDLYGVEEMEIVVDWINSCIDGYLTLRYRCAKTVRDVNLIVGANPEDPFEVEFRGLAPVYPDEAIDDEYVAFKLSDKLKTNGKIEILTLKWKAPDNQVKKAEFYYRTND